MNAIINDNHIINIGYMDSGNIKYDNDSYNINNDNDSQFIISNNIISFFLIATDI